MQPQLLQLRWVRRALLRSVTTNALRAVVLRRHVGLLVVQVVGARDLKKMDAFGKADPFVELSTQPHHTVKTVRAALGRMT